jgi:hypothetical protein
MPDPRSYERGPADIRPVSIEPGYVATADGSALIVLGKTKVICTASVSSSVPRWMEGRGKGWVTAEYAMLPASTGDRKARDVSRGKQDGRSVEIQRLIGRSLRVVMNFAAQRLRRLRRSPGRRRHPLRGDHRRPRRPSPGAAGAARRGGDRRPALHRIGCRGQRRRRRRAGALRSRLRRGLRCRGRRERRDDLRRRTGRGSGDR